MLAQADAAARGDIQAVDRVGHILALFADADPDTVITATTVAHALGLNRTTAHRYLTSMAAEGLLTTSGEPSGYALGDLMLRLGGLALGAQRVVAIAAERMARLAEDIAANISLSLWTPTGPMVAAVAEPPGQHIVLTFQVGTVLPLDTAQATVFLAFGNDAQEVEATLAALPEPDRAVARAKIAEVRRTGLATAVTEANGTCGMAAPIFDATGMCAALAIVDAIGALSTPAFPERLARLQAAAHELTGRLGGALPAAG